MSATNMKIIIPATELWVYFEKNRHSLIQNMAIAAQNDDYDVTIYLSNQDGLPCLTIESSNLETEEYVIEDKDDSSEIAEMVYELYLTDKVVSVMMDSFDDDDEVVELTPEELMDEREADIDSFVSRFLEDLLPDNPIVYSDLIEDVIADCKEHFLEYLYRKHNLSVYRPMELEDDEGVFVEDYPYECMEFEPCSLYDEKK